MRLKSNLLILLFIFFSQNLYSQNIDFSSDIDALLQNANHLLAKKSDLPGGAFTEERPSTLVYHPKTSLYLGRGIRNFDPTLDTENCLDFKTMDTNNLTAPKVDAEFKVVSSKKELREYYDVSSSVSARLKFLKNIGGEFSLSKLDEHVYSGDQFLIILKAQAVYPEQITDEESLKPEYLSLLSSNQTKEFIDQCGTHFIFSTKKKASVFVIIKGLSSKLKKKKEGAIKGSVKAPVGAFGDIGASVGAKSLFEEGFENGSLDISFHTLGGSDLSGLSGLIKSSNLDDLKLALSEYVGSIVGPGKENSNVLDVVFKTRSYNRLLGIQNDEFDQVQNNNEVLSQLIYEYEVANEEFDQLSATYASGVLPLGSNHMADYYRYLKQRLQRMLDLKDIALKYMYVDDYKLEEDEKYGKRKRLPLLEVIQWFTPSVELEEGEFSVICESEAVDNYCGPQRNSGGLLSGFTSDEKWNAHVEVNLKLTPLSFVKSIELVRVNLAGKLEVIPESQRDFNEIYLASENGADSYSFQFMNMDWENSVENYVALTQETKSVKVKVIRNDDTVQYLNLEMK